MQSTADEHRVIESRGLDTRLGQEYACPRSMLPLLGSLDSPRFGFPRAGTYTVLGLDYASHRWQLDCACSLDNGQQRRREKRRQWGSHEMRLVLEVRVSSRESGGEEPRSSRYVGSLFDAGDYRSLLQCDGKVAMAVVLRP